MKTLLCCLQHLRGCSLLPHPAQPRVTNTCRVGQEPEGTEHRDSTWLQGSVKEAARISRGTIHDRQREGGREGEAGLPPAHRSSTAWSAWKTGHSTLSASQGLQQPHLTCWRTGPTPRAVRGRGRDRRISSVAFSTVHCQQWQLPGPVPKPVCKNTRDEGICQRFQCWGNFSLYLNPLPKTWYFLVVITSGSGPSALCHSCCCKWQQVSISEFSSTLPPLK